MVCIRKTILKSPNTFSIRALDLGLVGRVWPEGGFSEFQHLLLNHLQVEESKEPRHCEVRVERKRVSVSFTMENFCVIFNAVLLYLATAAIPHDGIHWTYTGRLFCLILKIINVFCFFLKKEK